VKQDLAQATAVSETPDLEQYGCSLAGRIPVLHLHTGAGPITYPVGAAPSAIWRGRVLMRCGPAFGLDGLISGGSQTLNRVVIDGLAAKPQVWSGCRTHFPSVGAIAAVEVAKSLTQPFSVCLDSQSGVLALRIEQQLGSVQGASVQRISLEQVMGLRG